MNRQQILPAADDLYRLASADGACEAFSKNTFDAVGVVFPLDYLSRASCLRLISYSGEECGGAIVATDAPFRSLASIPLAYRSTVLSELKADSRIAEINGVWLGSQHRSLAVSFSFWTQLMSRLIQTGRTDFLFTFSNSNDRMRSLKELLKPTILYSGDTLQLPGMTGPGNESIALVNILAIRNFLEILRPHPMRSQQAGLLAGLGNVRIQSKRSVASTY